VRDIYVGAIVALGGVSVACAIGIFYGEASSRWYFGGALVGALLLCYSFIVLFLRKSGMIGPRKAER